MSKRYLIISGFTSPEVDLLSIVINLDQDDREKEKVRKNRLLLL